MSGSLGSLAAIIFVGVAVVLFQFSYAAYWALRIRQVLFVRLYRSQALSIAMVNVGLIVFYLAGVLASFTLYTVVATWLLSIVVLYWIDSSVLAGRKSDPLLRDTAHWSGLRFLVWGGNIGGISLSIVILAITSGIPSVSLGSPTVSGVSLGFLLPFVPPFSTGLSGLVALPIVARRSGDFTFRRHLVWFGYFLGILTFGGLSAVYFSLITQSPLYPLIVFIPTGLLGGFFLYRSARSLVPLNRIPLD